jgi:cystathionine beta-lyase
LKHESPFTRVVRAGGHGPAQLPQTVGPPVVRGSTVLMPTAQALYDDGAVTYGRSGLSTQETLIRALCDLEGAAGVRLFPSGIAAITAAMTAVLRAGDEVLVTDAIYKPTRRFCERVLRRFGVAVRYHHAAATAAEILALAGPATRLIVLESPGSLSFEMQDVPEIARLARERRILTLIDNTWAAGLAFRPLDHGVDLSVQSLTKFVGGHSDVFMGSAAARDPALVQALDETVIDFGWFVSADDAYLMLRGLRTLATRMQRCAQSALTLAAWLRERPEVAQVLHPALPGAPGHELWARDFDGGAGLFAIALRPCPEAAVLAFLDALTLFGLGFSWGGFESLALHCDPQLKVRDHEPNRPGPLVRLNIGLEDPADLIEDLERGFAALSAAS